MNIPRLSLKTHFFHLIFLIYFIINIFKKKQNNINDKPLKINSLNKHNKRLSKSIRNQYKNLTYYPSSTKEWFSSVYSYNKSYIKSLIVNDVILNKLFWSYSNMLQDKIKNVFKRRRRNKDRYSANKLYVSRAELKHTNTKLLVILFLYNKQKSTLEILLRKLLILLKVSKRIVKSVDDENNIKRNFTSVNRVFMMLKDQFSLEKTINTALFVKTDNLLSYLVLDVKRRYNYKILSYNHMFLRNLSKLQKRFFNYTKSINFNKSKFNNLVLYLRNMGLISLIQKLYDKKVEIKLVELKSIHLNSDVFSSAVALKLKDRKNKALSVLRKAILQMVKIPDLHTLITFDDYSKIMNKNNVINTIKQQVVSGVRFEAAGRLTRRLTAMRAIFKYRYVGSLKNIRSSFNMKSSTILRGHVKSNAQYTMINAKTRNGAFGLKNWVSSH